MKSYDPPKGLWALLSREKLLFAGVTHKGFLEGLLTQPDIVLGKAGHASVNWRNILWLSGHGSDALAKEGDVVCIVIEDSSRVNSGCASCLRMLATKVTEPPTADLGVAVDGLGGRFLLIVFFGRGRKGAKYQPRHPFKINGTLPLDPHYFFVTCGLRRAVLSHWNSSAHADGTAPNGHWLKGREQGCTFERCTFERCTLVFQVKG